MTDTAEPTTETRASSTGSGAYAELVAGLRDANNRGHTRPLAWRRTQLEAILTMLDENEGELVRALKEDLGRPAMEAFTADIGGTRTEVKHILKHFESWATPRKVSMPLTVQPAKGRIIPEPLGVALIISPWNYPIYLLVNPIAAAIAAGNCVVAKPSELSPACSAVLARLIPKYLDDQAVSVVEGGVRETTALLAQRFDHIFFTGSTNVGRIVMQAAAKHLTPVTLELGGKSPAIVAADADLDVAARRIMFGKFLNAGQTCIAPDYVLAEASVRDKLVDKMEATLVEFYGDDPKHTSDFGRVVNEAHWKRLKGLLDTSEATVAVGGQTDEEDRYIAPTVLVDPAPESAIMQEEIFGPLLPVLSVESVDEAVSIVTGRPKPLALYVFSGSSATAADVLERTSSGGACVNHCVMHIVPSELPFGGVGPSGIGAYHGKLGFDTFSHLKSVLYKPQKPDPKLMYPPYTALKGKIVRKAM
ncbi:MAG: aldehyde dehydrogenase family protein [Actinobacteria bacterium]|nr:aldehyde dehydrogenase family protein [Actinomycetota bacterium]